MPDPHPIPLELAHTFQSAAPVRNLTRLPAESEPPSTTWSIAYDTSRDPRGRVSHSALENSLHLSAESRAGANRFLRREANVDALARFERAWTICGRCGNGSGTYRTSRNRRCREQGTRPRRGGRTRS